MGFPGRRVVNADVLYLHDELLTAVGSRHVDRQHARDVRRRGAERDDRVRATLDDVIERLVCERHAAEHPRRRYRRRATNVRRADEVLRVPVPRQEMIGVEHDQSRS